MITEYNMQQLFQASFGSKPFKVTGSSDISTKESGYTLNSSKDILLTSLTGSTLSTQFYGIEIWLPVWFRDLPPGIGENGTLFVPYAVVKINGTKLIVRSQVADSYASAIESSKLNDYSISIKGFLIDKNRQWPEKELLDFGKLFYTNISIGLDNALTNIFLKKSDKVVITSFDLPEVQGGRKHVRPFSMQLKSDSIFNLTID